MSGLISTVTIIVALLLAAWALLFSALDRAPDRVQFIGAMITTGAVVLLVASAIGSWVRGEAPGEPVVFLGYALTAVLLPYGGWVVGKMEPTRWGSLIVGVAALIVPVLVVRMGQVWN